MAKEDKKIIVEDATKPPIEVINDEMPSTALTPFLTGPHIDRVRRVLLDITNDVPPFASAASRVVVVDSKIHPDQPTAIHIDAAGNLYVNATYLDSVKDDSELRTIIAHTLLHPMLWHIARKGTREEERFDRACDRSINFSLSVMGGKNGHNAFRLPGGWLMPQKPEQNEWAVERLYEVEPLIPKQPSNSSGKSKKQSGGQQQQQGKGGGQGQDDQGDDDDQSGSGNKPTQNPGQGCGMIRTPQPMDRQEMENQEMGWRMAAAYAADQAQRSAGKYPGWQVFGTLLTPPPARVRWQDLLRNTMQWANETAGRQDASWRRLHRRSHSTDVILPGFTAYQGVIAVVVDTSGSVDDASLRQVVGEIVSMAKTCKCQVFFVAHDADVTAKAWLHKVDAVEVSKRLVGRGGTAFGPAYAAVAEEKKAKFQAFIHFTDAMPFDPWPPVPKNVRGKKICALISHAVADAVPPYLQKVLVEIRGH